MRRVYEALLPTFESRKRIWALQDTLATNKQLKKFDLRMLGPQVIVHRLVGQFELEQSLKGQTAKTAGQISVSSFLKDFYDNTSNRPGNLIDLETESYRLFSNDTKLAIRLYPSSDFHDLQDTLSQDYRDALSDIGVYQASLNSVVSNTLRPVKHPQLSILKCTTPIPPETIESMPNLPPVLHFHQVVARYWP